jgi:hypothetical protein
VLEVFDSRYGLEGALAIEYSMLPCHPEAPALQAMGEIHECFLTTLHCSFLATYLHAVIRETSFTLRRNPWIICPHALHHQDMACVLFKHPSPDLIVRLSIALHVPLRSLPTLNQTSYSSL